MAGATMSMDACTHGEQALAQLLYMCVREAVVLRHIPSGNSEEPSYTGQAQMEIVYVRTHAWSKHQSCAQGTTKNGPHVPMLSQPALRHCAWTVLLAAYPFPGKCRRSMPCLGLRRSACCKIAGPLMEGRLPTALLKAWR